MGNSTVSRMPYPSNKEIELPLLKEIADAGGEVSTSTREVFRRVAAYFPQITDEELVRRNRPSDTVWENRVQWVRLQLVREGQIADWRSVGRQGIWRITEKGRHRLEREKAQLDVLLQEARQVERPQESVTPEERQRLESVHHEVQRQLAEVGNILGKFTKLEYRQDMYRFDVVWKDSEMLPRATHCFEVQDKGNLVEALAKLKHAYDIWRAELFLVVTNEEDKTKASQLLTPYFSGVFHEIGAMTILLTPTDVSEIHSTITRYKEVMQHFIRR